MTTMTAQKVRTATITFEDGYRRIGYLTKKLYSDYPTLYRVLDVEDFAQDTVTHFISKGFFEKYNPETTSPDYFIYAAMKNRAIDKLRQYNRRREVAPIVSDTHVHEGETLSIMDIIPDPSAKDTMGEMIVEEIMDILPKRHPSQKFRPIEHKGKVVRFGEYWVFKLTHEGAEKDDLASLFGVSSSTINTYLRKAKNRLAQHMGEA